MKIFINNNALLKTTSLGTVGILVCVIPSFIALSNQTVRSMFWVDYRIRLEQSSRNVCIVLLFSSRISIQGSTGFGLSRCCIQTSKSREQKCGPAGVPYRAETHSGKLRPDPPAAGFTPAPPTPLSSIRLLLPLHSLLHHLCMRVMFQYQWKNCYRYLPNKISKPIVNVNMTV